MATKPVLAPTPLIPVRGSTRTAPAWYSYLAMLVIDVAALSILYWLVVFGRYFVTPSNVGLYISLFPGISLFLVAFFVQGLYPGLLLHPAEEIRRVFQGVTAVFLLFLCTTFLWHNAQWYSRSIFLITWTLGAPAVLFARYGAREYLARCDWWGIPAVVLGSGPAAQRIVRVLTNKNFGIRILGVYDDLAMRNLAAGVGSGLKSRTPHLIASPVIHADYAIVALSDTTRVELAQLLRDCCQGFPHVLLVPDIPDLCSLGMTARDICGEVALEVPQRLFHKSAGVAKRVLDLVLGLLTLVILSPLFLVLMAVIKLTSPGPVFFGHTRYGRDGKTFKAMKFRTMVQNGDEVLQTYLDKNPEEKCAWQRDHKLKNDPRITSIGKILRRYSVDELPQLWNVLNGDMSLVGPRPIVGAEISKYGRGFDLYTRVLPGLTGLWQVSGRNNTTYEERVNFDEYYVRNWSIWMDAYILIRTVKVVLSAEGAY